MVTRLFSKPRSGYPKIIVSLAGPFLCVRLFIFLITKGVKFLNKAKAGQAFEK